MSLMGIDGLASGLDTTSLINQLMRVEAMPQTLLKQKSSTAQSFVSALQGLNTRIASLAEAAAKAAKPASWLASSGTSSSDAATVTTRATAQPSSVSFTVDQLAAAQTSVSATYRADGSAPVRPPGDPAAAALDLGIPPAVTVVRPDNTLVTVQPAGGSLAEVAQAINSAADAGVRATVVRAGVDHEGVPVYRLQLSGTATGAANDVQLYAGAVDQAAIDGGAPRLDATIITAARDAKVTLWSGTAAQSEFTSVTNTFSDLMTGVDITVTKLAGTDAPVTVTVGRDDAALTEMTKGLVGAMGVVLSEIISRTATTTRTNADGSTSVTGGLFTGDSAVRSIRNGLTDALSRPIGATSPSAVGIVLGRDGSFTFDEETFAAALASDPATVQTVVSGLAQRVADAATGISDKFDGSLTLKIQNQERQVRDLGTQIESWDRRLELRREGLQRTYSALEVTLSNLQGQSSWLSGQLAGLSANWQK